MKKPVSLYLLLILIAFQIVSAVPAGWMMIIDPSGAKLGLPIEMLEHSPFPNFLIPALFLFFVLGVFPIFIFFGLLRKGYSAFANRLNLFKDFHWSWTFSYYLGLLLILWINIQLIFIQGSSLLHVLYSTLGVAIIFMTQLPITSHYFKKSNPMNKAGNAP